MYWTECQKTRDNSCKWDGARERVCVCVWVRAWEKEWESVRDGGRKLAPQSGQILGKEEFDPLFQGGLHQIRISQLIFPEINNSHFRPKVNKNKVVRHAHRQIYFQSSMWLLKCLLAACFVISGLRDCIKERSLFISPVSSKVNWCTMVHAELPWLWVPFLNCILPISSYNVDARFGIVVVFVNQLA